MHFLNKNGFTLMEVLTVIVVITTIMMITIPLIGSITSKNQEELYHSYEKMMEEYAMASNIKDRDIQLSELEGLDQIKEECTGYVKVTLEPPRNYKAFITCGDKYSTGTDSNVITIMAGAGISKLSLSGWENSGTDILTKEVAKGTILDLRDFVPTFKTGYSCTDGCEFTKTMGVGILSGSNFKANGSATIIIDATDLTPPVFDVTISSSKVVYGSASTLLSYTKSTQYDEGVTYTPTYMYDTNENGSFENSQTATIGSTSHKGVRYYKGMLTVDGDTKTNGDKVTSSAVSSNVVSLTMVRTKYIPDANNCGTLSSTNAIYAYKGENTLYSDELNGIFTSFPMVHVKSGYAQTGWFASPTCSPKVLNNNSTFSGNIVDRIVTTNAWNATSDTTLYAQCENTYGTLNSTLNKLSNPTCTNDVGLCDDPVEAGRKVYRGTSVNNYITFAGKTWRIMAVEANGKMKIIDMTGGVRIFDDVEIRTVANGTGSTYCTIIGFNYGCSAWSNVSPKDGTPLKGNKKSSLNIYLNSTYYNSIQGYSSYIASCPTVVNGVCEVCANLQRWYDDEKKVVSNETVSIMSISDVLRASSIAKSGTACNGNTCLSSNWLVDAAGSRHYWVTDPSADNNAGYKTMINGTASPKKIASFILQRSYSTDKYYFPVIYLNGNISITGGDGTSSNPYVVGTELTDPEPLDPIQETCDFSIEGYEEGATINVNASIVPLTLNSTCESIGSKTSNNSVLLTNVSGNSLRLIKRGSGTITLTLTGTAESGLKTVKTYTVVCS